MNDTLLSIAFGAFFLLGTFLTVFFLVCMIVDEEKRGAGK